MKNLITILIFIPLFGFAQQRQDTIYVIHYVSNPPMSEFICDTGKCEGLCESFYKNGTTHIKGEFKDGQPIDTLFTYNSNGVIEELFIPNKKGWRMMNYFENGQLKSDYDVAKRKEIVYYATGNLKKENTWDSKYRSKIKEYNNQGILVLEESDKFQKQFDSIETLKSLITRKEVLIFNRIFSKDKSRFYEYNWTTYDQNGNTAREIIFNESGFLGSPFPANYDEIKDFLFEKVTFYKDGEEFKKVEFKYVKENDDLIKKLVIYVKENNQWIEEKTTTANKVYEIIASLSA